MTKTRLTKLENAINVKDHCPTCGHFIGNLRDAAQQMLASAKEKLGSDEAGTQWLIDKAPHLAAELGLGGSAIYETT